MNAISIEQAYRHCQQIARQHYENFPVASKLLPAKLRRPIAVIYAFARRADDIADEGEQGVAERYRWLDGEAERIARLPGQVPVDDPVLIALADVINRHQLPLRPFLDLLSAFRQDIDKQRYENFFEVLDYCRRSAQPVGRLLLLLNGHHEAAHLAAADALCRALQLINFYQDMAQDYDENGRIYLPVDEMRAYGIDADHIRLRQAPAAFTDLMQQQTRRCRAYLAQGTPLGWQIGGRLGFELRLTALGGWRILDRLEAAHRQGNFFCRPRLRRSDILWIVGRSLIRPPQARLAAPSCQPDNREL